MISVPALRREIVVAADPEAAFRVFTERIGAWWPLAELSVYGAAATVSFDRDQIVEVGPAGQRSVWGSVISWEPGNRLDFTWHPGGTPERASRVQVRFAAEPPGTRVTVIHEGWEVFGDPHAARAEYDHGWEQVLARYGSTIPEAA